VFAHASSRNEVISTDNLHTEREKSIYRDAGQDQSIEMLVMEGMKKN
jgi:hypothetical protein